MKRSIFLAAAAAACLSIPAAAQQRTEVGLLDCTIEGGAGFIVGSQKDLTCTFTPAGGAQPAEAYVGTVTKFGLDVGVTGVTLMRWLVVAPTGTPLPAGALAGDYVGASADGWLTRHDHRGQGARPSCGRRRQVADAISVVHGLDDLVRHLLGVAEQHHRAVLVEQRVVDAGIA
ncbi:MAG: hypothetical protein K0S21_2462 [Rhizobiaceae bacterium]|nr:hypothetical protein [Rhizobiaceae bacterium]